MLLAQLGQRAFGQDVAAVQDGKAVAEPLGLAHDVRAEQDALALVAELGHGLSSARATSTSRPAVASSKISTGGSWTRARAIETFCFMPVDIFAPSTSRISFICSRVKMLFHPLAQQLRGQAVQPAEILDHFPGGHPVVDGRVGRDEADLLADQGRLREHVVAVDRGRAAGRAAGRC